MKDSGLDRIETKISANDPMKVALFHSVVANESKFLCEPFVVADGHAGVTRRPQVLGREKAEEGSFSHRACL